MLELHVANNDVTGGNISVGWCVSVDTLKLLADKGIKNPAVVLVTAPADKSDLQSGDKVRYHIKREFRKVVPLKDLVAYVEFLSPGESHIWGFIVSSEKEARKKFLEKHNGIYCEEILSDDGAGWRYNKMYLGMYAFNVSDIDTLLSESVKVFVPVDCFAPEPAAWEKAWVNHFIKHKTIDQCEFRRRRLFAYTIQPILMFFNLLFRLGCLIWASAFGLRGWSLDPLLHPLTYEIDAALEVADITNGTHFVGRGENQYLNWARLPFMPIFFLVYYSIWHSHVVLGAGIALLTLVSIVGLAIGTYFLYNWYAAYSAKAEELSTAWYMDEQERNYVLCNTTGKKATSLSQLPFAKRTLRLRFQNLKTQVCRPFSA